MERRTLEDGLDLGWDVVSILPAEELVRIREEDLKKHYKKKS